MVAEAEANAESDQERRAEVENAQSSGSACPWGRKRRSPTWAIKLIRKPSADVEAGIEAIREVLGGDDIESDFTEIS